MISHKSQLNHEVESNHQIMLMVKMHLHELSQITCDYEQLILIGLI